MMGKVSNGKNLMDEIHKKDKYVIKLQQELQKSKLYIGSLKAQVL